MTSIIPARSATITRTETDALEAFSAFLGLRVADGDASPHTVRAYRQHVAAFVTWCRTRDLTPAHATAQDLEDYRKYLIEQGYKRKTIAAKLQGIERFFAATIWRGLRPDNPAAGIRAPRDKTDRAEAIKFLPRDAVKRLLKAAHDHPRDLAILAILGYHGPRVSEVAALDLTDLDLDADPPTLRIRAGKGHKERTLYLVPSSTDPLRAWLTVRPSDQVDPAAVFLTLDRANFGQRIDVRSIRRRVDHYLSVTGLKREGVSCHALRHTFGTWAAYAGAPTTSLKADLGHASLDTTGIYVQVADRLKQNPARYLEELYR
jgi:site-specific recombinase XerD